jgi:hypothetical protein
MKWGVRKTPFYRLKKSIKRGMKKFKENSVDKKKVMPKTSESPVKKSVKDMSDKELMTILNRLDMEKRYADHMARLNPKKESKVKKLLGEALGKTVSTMLNKGSEALVNKILTGDAKSKKKDKENSDDDSGRKKTSKSGEQIVRIIIDQLGNQSVKSESTTSKAKKGKEEVDWQLDWMSKNWDV